jgi:hypothetical protein
MYCSDGCYCSASCSNDASPESAKIRTEAIVDALKRNPNSFRLRLEMIARAQRDKEEKAQESKKQGPDTSNVIKIKSVEAVGAIRVPKLGNHIGYSQEHPYEHLAPEERDIAAYQRSQATQAGSSKKYLPPTYSTQSLVVNDTQVMSLAVSTVHADPLEKQERPKPPPRPASAKRDKKRPYHDLMVGSSTGKKQKASGLPEVEAKWLYETKRVASFFTVMRSLLDGKKLSKANFETGRAVNKVLESVQEDMQGCRKVVDVAKLDIMARLREPKTWYPRGRLALDREDEDPHGLLCTEKMPPAEGKKEMSEEDLKEYTILAAQDAALLQEAARVIRRKARELCERRMEKKKTSSV